MLGSYYLRRSCEQGKSWRRLNHSMLCSDNYAYVDVIISQLDQSACIIAHNAHIAVNYRRKKHRFAVIIPLNSPCWTISVRIPCNPWNIPADNRVASGGGFTWNGVGLIRGRNSTPHESEYLCWKRSPAAFIYWKNPSEQRPRRAFSSPLLSKNCIPSFRLSVDTQTDAHIQTDIRTQIRTQTKAERQRGRVRVGGWEEA